MKKLIKTIFKVIVVWTIIDKALDFLLLDDRRGEAVERALKNFAAFAEKEENVQ